MGSERRRRIALLLLAALLSQETCCCLCIGLCGVRMLAAPSPSALSTEAAVRRLQHAQDAESILNSAIEGWRAGSLKQTHVSQGFLRAAKRLLASDRASSRAAAIAAEDRLEALFAAAVSAKGASPKRIVEAFEACSLLQWVPESAAMLAAVADLDAQAHALDPSDATSAVWSLDRLSRIHDDDSIGLAEAAPALCRRVAALGLPFSAHARLLSGGLMRALRGEVDFRRDTIALDGGARPVSESRLTAWQSTNGALAFEYSGKVMAPRPMTPTVLALREQIRRRLGLKFDGVLINLYENGKCGMRFHADPDVGPVWTDETVVVSVGDTRTFVMRDAIDHNRRHAYAVSDGDAVRMFGPCQALWQHCIRVEKDAAAAGPRISLVFKQSVAHAGSSGGGRAA